MPSLKSSRGGRSRLGEDEEASFEHVEFEMPIYLIDWTVKDGV